MKKYVLFIFIFMAFTLKVNAENKFHLGEKITDMYYIMDKNGTKVFANFKNLTKLQEMTSPSRSPSDIR